MSPRQLLPRHLSRQQVQKPLPHQRKLPPSSQQVHKDQVGVVIKKLSAITPAGLITGQVKNCPNNKYHIKHSTHWIDCKKTGEGSFKTDNIDVNVCTHLVYAFAVLDTQTHTMKVYDTWLDESLKNYQNFVALKEKNKNLKTLIAIGGWTDSQNNAQAYRTLFNSQSLIDEFARYKKCKHKSLNSNLG